MPSSLLFLVLVFIPQGCSHTVPQSSGLKTVEIHSLSILEATGLDSGAGRPTLPPHALGEPLSVPLVPAHSGHFSACDSINVLATCLSSHFPFCMCSFLVRTPGERQQLDSDSWSYHMASCLLCVHRKECRDCTDVNNQKQCGCVASLRKQKQEPVLACSLARILEEGTG